MRNAIYYEFDDLKEVTPLKIFAITNQKGGVGKTTTTINLAASLADKGKRVLLVDLDPQGNATMGSGVDKHSLDKSVYHMLLGLHTPAEVRVKAKVGYDVIPSNRELAGAEIELVELEHRDTRLRDALNELQGDYDFVLMDCPPALNMLTINALAAAHSVMIPMQCEYYALEGLSDLVDTIRRIRKSINPRLEIEGLLRTMFDPRNLLATQVSAQLEQHFGNKVYETVIPRNVRLAEAPSHGIPAIRYDRNARGSRAYEKLSEELLTRLGER